MTSTGAAAIQARTVTAAVAAVPSSEAADRRRRTPLNTRPKDRAALMVWLARLQTIIKNVNVPRQHTRKFPAYVIPVPSLTYVE